MDPPRTGVRSCRHGCAVPPHASDPDLDALLQPISVDPAVSFGRPVVRGTRIWVGLILGALAHGDCVEQLLDEYPDLTETDIRARLAYGATLANGRLTDLPAAGSAA